MKIATYIISVIALIICVINITKINLESPLEGDSFTATVCALTAGCAILIVNIIRLSKKIDKKTKNL